MTKWVTILLLTLAILAYGLSRMRPAPQEATPDSTATPDVVAQTPDAPEAPASPQALATSGPIKAPNFGPPPGSEPTPLTPTSTPGATAVKSDPFSAQKQAVPITGTIKATIISDSVSGLARTKFALDQEAIYLTATPEGLDDQVEVVASYRSVMDESAPFSAPVNSSGPPRKRTFRLSAPENGWEPGPYQVVLKAKNSDQVLGLDRFEILAKDHVPESMPDPEYVELVPNLEAEKPQTSFKSEDQKIFLRVSGQELAPGTNIRTIWSAVEVDKLQSGELIAVSNRPAPGPGKDAVFTYEAPPGGFHSGSYKVDVYFDQELANSQAFFIDPPKTSNR
ncbi:MAG: hypothetical protein WC314_19350 [Vulcanimicrobiota bacterium]